MRDKEGNIMIVISIENSKRKMLVDTKHQDLAFDEDNAFLLKEWGITDASYAMSYTLEAADKIIHGYLGDFTTLKDTTTRSLEGAWQAFIKRLYPQLKQWDDGGRKDALFYQDFITDANGVKRYICLIFQDIIVFNL